MIRLIVYSDYLCPWCYNGVVRLRRLERDFDGQVVLSWRSFLLRPQPDPRVTLEKFRSYTRSWLRPAAEPDGATFRVWESNEGPPSHSVPPHLVAKAAARLGAASFNEIHERLLHAYFVENRDITAEPNLRAIWREAGLAAAEFEYAYDPEILRTVLAEHSEAVEQGITGVPTVCMEGRDGFVMGSQPLELYQRWVSRALQEQAS